MYYLWMLARSGMLSAYYTGTGIKHLTGESLKKLPVPVPPLSEQKRIVARIEELFSELDSGVETLKKTKQQLAVYRQSVLKAAFAHVAEKKTIREMSSVVTSGSRGWAQYYSDNGARFIRIGNLTRGGIKVDLSDVQHVDLPDDAEGKRTQLKPNDVLVSITADLGSIGLVPDNIGDAYVNQHIAMVRFNNPTQGKFMAWYLRSDYGQKDLLKNKRGGGKLGLGLDDIRGTKVPVMSDAEAAGILATIEARFSVCDSIEKTVDVALQQADAMRQSILKKAFEGKL
jgi:type I restriction enzyme S subunit